MYREQGKYAGADSAANKSVKFIQSLSKRKAREENGCFFLEGERAVSELADSGAELKLLVVTKEYVRSVEASPARSKIYATLKKRADEVLTVSFSVFKSLCDTVTPQGIGAVAAMPQRRDIRQSIAASKRLLVLENIQDPGNMGSCIRTADAFGFDAVLCVGDCVDAYNSKVLRSTVGSLLHIDVYAALDMNETAELLHANGYTMYGAIPRGGVSVGSEEYFTDKTAILIGNEGAGLTETAKRLCDRLITIDMKGRAESLNAGIAAAVLMYEVVRRKDVIL